MPPAGLINDLSIFIMDYFPFFRQTSTLAIRFALRYTDKVGLMLMLWILCFSQCENSELIPKDVAFITSSMSIICVTMLMLC